MFLFNKSLMSAVGLLVAAGPCSVVAIPNVDDESSRASAVAVASAPEVISEEIDKKLRLLESEGVPGYLKDGKCLHYNRCLGREKAFLKACKSDLFEEIEIVGEIPDLLQFPQMFLAELSAMDLPNLKSLHLGLSCPTDMFQEQELACRKMFNKFPGLKVTFCHGFFCRTPDSFHSFQIDESPTTLESIPEEMKQKIRLTENVIGLLLKADGRRLFYNTVHDQDKDFLEACESDLFEEIEISGKECYTGRRYLASALQGLSVMDLSKLKTLYMRVLWPSDEVMEGLESWSYARLKESELAYQKMFHRFPGLRIGFCSGPHAFYIFHIDNTRADANDST